MGLLQRLFRTPAPPDMIWIRLINGPLDGGSFEIARAKVKATVRGPIWSARWHGDVRCLYAFEMAPEVAWHDDILRQVYVGRHIGWEKRA